MAMAMAATMKLSTIRRRLRALPVALLLLTSTALAQDMVTEVLAAGFRDAQELAAILRPLIPAPGSVAGFHNQLVIKTTAANLAELRQLLAKLDKAPANLLISVRRTLDDEISRDLAQARLALRSRGGPTRRGGTQGRNTGDDDNTQRSNDARAGVGGGTLDAQIRRQQRTLTNQDSSTQSLRVLEGKEAFIQSGESIAVGNRQVIVTGAGVVVSEGTRQEEFGSGFWARARVSGDQVALEIYPDQRRRRGDGNASVQRTSTSVSGVLGQWMEIGSENGQAVRDGSGNSSGNSSGSNFGGRGAKRLSTRQQRSTYVKVERLD